MVAMGDVDPRLMGVKVLCELTAADPLGWADNTEGEGVSAGRGGGGP